MSAVNNIPKISIIIPVYNVENYLAECIDSVLKQTYSNFELILVDDGSKDKSGDICEEFAKQHSNIKVFHQENKGQSSARNLGVKHSKAEWILFVDSDDLIHSQLLEFLLRAAEDNKVDMSMCGIIKHNDIPEDFYKRKDYEYEIITINDSSLYSLYKSNDDNYKAIYWMVYPKLIKKSLYIEYPLVEGRIFEDNEVACKWLVESKRIAFVNIPMYFYRFNPTGTMNQRFSAKKLDYLWALESMISFYNNLNYTTMLNGVINEYFPVAVHLCNRVFTELKDEKLCKSVMRDVEYKYKLYSKLVKIDLSVYIKDSIFKYAHPIKFRIRKKFRNIINTFK